MYSFDNQTTVTIIQHTFSIFYVNTIARAYSPNKRTYRLFLQDGKLSN